MSKKISLSLTITAWADKTTDCSIDYSINSSNLNDFKLDNEKVLDLFCLNYLNGRDLIDTNINLKKLQKLQEEFTFNIGQALANEQPDDRD